MKKVLYIAPRFHTNQVYPVKSLVRNGVDVRFFSQYSHKAENYEDITPNIIGYSPLFTIISPLLSKLQPSMDKDDFSRKYGIPPIIKFIKEILDFNPDLVIVRDYSRYSYVCLLILKVFRKKTILYTQQPLYGRKYRELGGMKKNLKMIMYDLRSLICKYEMTPILGSDISDELCHNSIKKACDDECNWSIQENIHSLSPLGLIRNTFFVPLVIDKNYSFHLKKKVTGNSLNILIVAEFQERKKILEFLEIFNSLIKNGKNIHLTIVGNAKKAHTLKYLQKVKSYVGHNGLNDNITIKTDLTHHEVLNEYLVNDFFVLPSVREPASYSILEAMSSGLPVISSTSNGTKDYIMHGKNGFIFDANNFSQLYDYLSYFIEKPHLLKEFGENSQKLIDSYYYSDRYYESLKLIYKTMGEHQS